MKYSKLYILLFLVIGYNLRLYSQSFNFKNYNTEQGLPQSQVLSIYQDKKGMIWFGTNGGGVGKYDGNSFKTINNNDGLISNSIYSIIENSNNDLIFGTDKGISVYNGISFKNYAEKDGLKKGIIFKLVSNNNTVWICTQEGVYTMVNNKIIPFTANELLNKSSVYTLFIDSKDNIWFGTLQNGIIYYNTQTKEFKQLSVLNGLSNELVFSISEKENGDIIVGTQTGLNSINKTFKIKTENDFTKQNNIAFSAILKTNTTHFLFGTYAEGIAEYDFLLKNINYYNLSNGLTNNPVLCLFKDRENNIWIGTDGAGVYKFKNKSFTYFSKTNGLPENYINAVGQDKLGNYWIATRSNGICKLNNKSQLEIYNRNLQNSIGLFDNNINTMLSLNDGIMLFGTNEGLYKFDNKKFELIFSSIFKQEYILCLYQDSKSAIWIGTAKGLFCYKNGIITEEISLNKFKNEGTDFSFFSILEDKNHTLWVGTEAGVINIGKNDTPILYNQTTKFINSRVLSMTIDANKNLWFGTEDGLFHYDYKTFTKISQTNGLHSNTCIFLQIDNKNRLIIGLNSGLDILNIDSYYKNKIEITHLNKYDGLIGLEANYNGCFKDKNGQILIGTTNGLEIYNPNEDEINTKEALIKINSVKLFFGQEDIFKYSIKDTVNQLPTQLKLPFNKNNLTFEYIGVSLSAPEKVKYQYKLEGLDNDWTPISSKTEVTYSSLQPGTYTFYVKACNNDGLWNKTPASFSFEIKSPWYKTWWFFSICALVSISLIIYYNRFKTKKLKEDKLKLETQVTERTKELRWEKEKVEIINKEVIEQKNLVEHKNLEIVDSIKYAKNIQEALLPNLTEVTSLFNNSFVLYMPKDIVSGDFYWFAKTEKINFIAAVDCTGHGVPGAFMSIVGNTLLNEIVNERKITKPSTILLELHKGVKIALNQNVKEFERRDGMDIALCAYDISSHKLEYAGANRPLWIYRKNKNYELEVIKPTKFPIGGLEELDENRSYQNHEIDIEQGDCLYLFTDGFADQFGGPKGKKYMVSNLQKMFSAHIHLSMDKQKDAFVSEFNNWKLDTEQVDDVLMIGIKL